MIITNDNHKIIKNHFGKKPIALRYPKIFMVSIAYSFILKYYNVVSIPVVVISFPLFRRMKGDFMELYLVREQFQIDMHLVRCFKLVVDTFLSVCKRIIIDGAIIGK